MEYQPEQHKKNYLTQGIDKRSLDKANAADTLYLGKLQPEYLIRVFIQAADLLLCKPQAFDKLYIPERFSGSACQRVGLRYDIFLNDFYFPAQHIGHYHEQEYTTEIYRRQRPVNAECKYTDKYDPNDH